MRTTRFGLLTLLLLVMNSLHCEELIKEVWAGKVTMPGTDEKENVSYKVKASVYKITMIYNSNPYELENLVIKDDKITFDLNTGTPYKCELERKSDKLFSGDCTEKDSENIENSINISMILPE